MRGVVVCVLFVCVLCVVCVPSLVSGQTTVNNAWVPDIDLKSARSARVRFLSIANTRQQSITGTIVQYSNASGTSLVDPVTFHSNIVNGVSMGGDDHEIIFPKDATNYMPVTSAILRSLKPSTNYKVQIAYYDTSSPPVIRTGGTNAFDTQALSGVVSLSSLFASGCGQLSGGVLYYLSASTDPTTNNIVYSCTVVAETQNLVVQIIPAHAYATINTATTPPLTSSNATTVTSPYVDPLTLYNTSVPLSAQGSVTNFTWTVTAENGTTQGYVLSVTRAFLASTAQVTGPSSPVVALLKSPSTPTVFSYRALLWQSTVVSSWKVWSDDFVVFPFTSFNVSFPNIVAGTPDTTYAAVSVTPAIHSTPAGSCSAVNVAIFDTSNPPKSSYITTCISALDDTCSSTPYGAATVWQTPFDTNGNIQANVQVYYPAPPFVGFPAA